MKKSIILLILVLTLFTKVKAQQDSTVEQYCEVIATGKLFSNKVTIDIDFGEERSVWKDHRLKDEEGKFKKFNSVVDAMNYMGKTGWTLVNAFPISEGNGPKVYHYVYKKQFHKSETE